MISITELKGKKESGKNLSEKKSFYSMVKNDSISIIEKITGKKSCKLWKKIGNKIALFEDNNIICKKISASITEEDLLLLINMTKAEISEYGILESFEITEKESENLEIIENCIIDHYFGQDYSLCTIGEDLCFIMVNGTSFKIFTIESMQI